MNADCRTTVFHAGIRSLADAVPELLARGVRHYRIELLAQPPAKRGGQSKPTESFGSSIEQRVYGEVPGIDQVEKLQLERPASIAAPQAVAVGKDLFRRGRDDSPDPRPTSSSSCPFPHSTQAVKIL